MLNKNRLMGAIACAGLTQKELAERIKMSKNTMNSKINGKSYFDTLQIEKICNELGIVDDYEKAVIFLGKSSQNRDELTTIKRIS